MFTFETMKKAGIYFLYLVFLLQISRIDGYEVIWLKDFVENAVEHLSEGDSLSAFLSKHYGSLKKDHYKHKHPHKKPLKHPGHCSFMHFHYFLPNEAFRYLHKKAYTNHYSLRTILFVFHKNEETSRILISLSLIRILHTGVCTVLFYLFFNPKINLLW